MKDYKPILLQLLNECTLAHLETIFLTTIDFSKWELVVWSEEAVHYFLFQTYYVLGLPCKTSHESWYF